jgi:PAS domain S-box-containing protein
LKMLASQAAISLENTRLYSDLQEREAKIRRLVDANIIGIFIWNLKGEIIEANEAFLEIVGYEREDFVSRQIGWLDLTPPELRELDERAIAELKATGIVQPFQREYFRVDGTRVPVLVGCALFKLGGTEGVAFVLDLREQKRGEEELRKAQADLAHVVRVMTLGELSASVAHEISQPIGAVVNNAGACLRWLAAQNLEEAKRSASLVVENGHRAGEILRRIRALSVKAPPQMDWLDVNATIGEVIAMTSSEVQRNHVSLRTELASDLPPVYGDRIQLQQVLFNLIINAIEAMSRAGEASREIKVNSQKVAEAALASSDSTLDYEAFDHVESTRVLVAVQDSGPGLDPMRVEHIFDAFYTTKPQGLGMGLAISRSIVEAHKGRIWASNTGQGSVFQFALPVRDGRSE